MKLALEGLIVYNLAIDSAKWNFFFQRSLTFGFIALGLLGLIPIFRDENDFMNNYQTSNPRSFMGTLGTKVDSASHSQKSSDLKMEIVSNKTDKLIERKSNFAFSYG